MSTDLLLSLGHNASAVAIRDGKIVAGYEEERLTKIKSDSHFPTSCISAIGIFKYDTIYVSHWDPLCNLNNMKEKYWRPDLLPDHDNLVTLNRDFTHHDAHAFSACAFCDKDIVMGPDTWIIIADGFGNYGEVISIYQMNIRGYPTLVQRIRGYNNSLGLMYQYATANVGMRMNQDEYKFLGYESKITDIDYERTVLPLVDRTVSRLIDGFETTGLFGDFDPLFNLNALLETQLYWDNILAPLNRNKTLVASTVQSILEECLSYFIHRHNMNNVILAGGVFLNVKANLHVLKNIPGQMSVMPLSGDQGAPLGLYKRNNPEWNMPKDLCWGNRFLYSSDFDNGIIYCENHDDVDIQLLMLLKDDYIVNVIKGSMEFGPRALGNTSTIARPTKENVEYINMVNGRDTIMPMAPMIHKDRARYWLRGCQRIINSLDYMIIALPYKHYKPEMRGAAHILPLESDQFTGRPQLMSPDDPTYGLSITEYSILINTSFNIHGKPIVCTIDDIVDAHRYQKRKDRDNRIVTLILGDK